MPLSHFVSIYPSPSPCPQVHSLHLRLNTCIVFQYPLTYKMILIICLFSKAFMLKGQANIKPLVIMLYNLGDYENLHRSMQIKVLNQNRILFEYKLALIMQHCFCKKKLESQLKKRIFNRFLAETFYRWFFVRTPCLFEAKMFLYQS